MFPLYFTWGPYGGVILYLEFLETRPLLGMPRDAHGMSSLPIGRVETGTRHHEEKDFPCGMDAKSREHVVEALFAVVRESER